FSPSNFTSMDQAIKLALPFILLVTKPFFGALPASSRVLVLKYDLFLSTTSLPEIMTVLLPSAVSLAIAVLGYGIGTPGVVAGVKGGVKHTSGNAATVLPSAALQAMVMPLAYTSTPTS